MKSEYEQQEKTSRALPLFIAIAMRLAPINRTVNINQFIKEKGNITTLILNARALGALRTIPNDASSPFPKSTD